MESDAGISSLVFSTAKVKRKDERAKITSVKDAFVIPGRVTKKGKKFDEMEGFDCHNQVLFVCQQALNRPVVIFFSEGSKSQR